MGLKKRNESFLKNHTYIKILFNKPPFNMDPPASSFALKYRKGTFMENNLHPKPLPPNVVILGIPMSSLPTERTRIHKFLMKCKQKFFYSQHIK